MYVWIVTNRDGKFLEVFKDDENTKARIKASVELTHSNTTQPEHIVETTDLMVWSNGIEAARMIMMDKINHL